MALTKVPSNLDATVATTQSASDNSTNVATTAYVTTAIANLVDGAPSTLNTLDEIAAALNDDAALNTTLTNSIATKLPLAGGNITGNLGIGQASPSAPLDLVTNSTVYAAEFTQSNTSNGDGVFISVGSTAAADYALTVRSDAGNTSVLAAKADGKVGIGTFTPAHKLHISGTGHQRIKVEKTDAGGDVDIELAGPSDSTGWLLFKDTTSGNNSGVIKYVHTGDYMSFRTNGTDDRMRITSNGNIGIGTNNPSVPLHINSTNAASNRLAIFESDINNTNEYSTISVGHNQLSANFGLMLTTSDTAYVGVGSSGNAFDPTTGAGLYVNANGNVGIGEIQPAAPLHVEHSSGTAYNGAAEITESLIVSNKNGTDNSGVNNVVSIGLHVADGATSQGFINYVRSANNQGYFSLSQRTAASTYEEQFTLDREGQAFIYGTSPYMQIRDTTAGGGAGNGGQVIFSGRHAGANDGFREFAKIVGVKANSTGGATDGYMGFYVNKGAASTTESMRLDEDGELIVGTAVLGDTYNPLVTGVTSDALVVGRHGSSGSLGLWRTNTMEWKYYHNGIGYIMTFGSNGVISGDFNDTSDLNLKENVSTIEDGTTVIKALRPVKFDWKASGKGNNQHGFIAQEVEKVLPDAVEGNDYVENATGHPDHEPVQNGKAMNSNAVLAHAVKAIQELEARIKILEG